MKHEPAFPRPASPAHEYGFHKHQDGMTLRDYFAAKAMDVSIHQVRDYYELDKDEMAKWCFEMADAMLKAREA